MMKVLAKAVMVILQCINVSNEHLKLTQCYLSIICQWSWKKVKYLLNTKLKDRNSTGQDFEKFELCIKLGGLSKNCEYNVISSYFVQMPRYITHYVFFFSPYFLPGIWSSNSLGKPWQGCKARIYGSADGTCAVTFASSGIFSSGKSICKARDYT